MIYAFPLGIGLPKVPSLGQLRGISLTHGPKEHVEKLNEGVEAWNEWRQESPDTYYWLLPAKGHLKRKLFAAMLGRIWALPVPGG